MRALPVLLAVAAALTAGSAAAQTVTHVETVNGLQAVDQTTQTTDTKLGRDSNYRMTVAVRVAGAGPYRFVVDTGADRTVVSREVADRLQLPTGPRAMLHSVTGSDAIRTAMVGSIEFTAKRVNDVNAAVLEATNIGADGILGTDSLKAQRVQFDFTKKTLSISSARSAPRDDPGTIVVQARRQSGRLILTEALADGHDVAVVVDTGSDLTIGNRALQAMLQRRGLLRENGMIEMISVTGAKLPGEYTFLRTLELGGVTLHNLAIVFADAHTFAQLKLDEKPAMLLGMNAIRAFDKVSIDFAARKLRVLLPQGSEREVASQELAQR